MPEASTDHRRATAERNVAAILDAAEGLLERGAAVSTTAVAAAAGVSRVTVYAHFPNREALLEAVAERAVGRAIRSFDDIDLESGPAPEALQRLIEAGWRELDHHRAVAQAASEHLGNAALMRAHEAPRAPIAALVERGRAEGAFRTDLPVDWLVTSYFALMHACGDEVRAGKLDAGDAVRILQTSIGDLYAGRG
jgi:TetR/AcrR family transcriptional repressor of mexCD-oprJ operon